MFLNSFLCHSTFLCWRPQDTSNDSLTLKMRSLAALRHTAVLKAEIVPSMGMRPVKHLEVKCRQVAVQPLWSPRKQGARRCLPSGQWHVPGDLLAPVPSVVGGLAPPPPPAPPAEPLAGGSQRINASPCLVSQAQFREAVLSHLRASPDPRGSKPVGSGYEVMSWHCRLPCLATLKRCRVGVCG